MDAKTGGRMNFDANAAKVGVLCWEAGQVPEGLLQLEDLVGNSTNPASYHYPVRFHRVQGANVHTILERPDQSVLRTMVADARMMVSQGIKAISTSCGFNAVFQRELAGAVGVPVMTSSLLQVPLVRQIHGPNCEICVITANAGALSPKHLQAVGIESTDGLHIVGLEQCTQWRQIFSRPDARVDLDAVEHEVLGVALQALDTNPAIRAFVLECTDLPPYSAAIRARSGLPVFDFITMVNYLHSTL